MAKLELERDMCVECGPDLHVSLSRTLYVRFHERRDLEDRVRRAVLMTPIHVDDRLLRLRTWRRFVNDAADATFVALLVADPIRALDRLVSALDSQLAPLGLEPYYAERAFHASLFMTPGNVPIILPVEEGPLLPIGRIENVHLIIGSETILIPWL